MKHITHPYRIGVTTHDNGTFGVIFQMGGFSKAEAEQVAKNLEHMVENNAGNTLQLKPKVSVQ